MQYFDITVSLAAGLPVFPGDPPVTVEPLALLGKGDPSNVSRLGLCTHSGTHIDAPRHYDDGGLTVDGIPLPVLIGAALVVEIPQTREIGRATLAALPLDGVERLLLKTDNSKLWEREGFFEDYAALTEEGAAYLLKRGVRLVGIDYLSVESFAGDGRVHRLLLSGGVVILEGINLSGVPPGRYELICLPLKIAEGDGAPARAVLRRPKDVHRHGEFDPHTTRWPLS